MARKGTHRGNSTDATLCKLNPTLSATPRSPADAVRARADALLQAGRHDEAIPAYRELLSIAPEFADGWFNLGYLLQLAGQFADAVACYERAIQFGVDHPEEAWRNKALILTEHLARPLEAEQALRAALHCNDRYVPAWVDLGRVAEETGRRDEAGAAYESALSVDPSHALALSHLANVRRPKGADDPLVARLRQAASESSRSAADRAALGFALGKLLDGVGAYDDAFLAYALANQASRESADPGWRGYDRSAWEGWVDRLPGWFLGATLAAPPDAGQTPRLIFVCGMFRSGSTLVETILASHGQVTAGGEMDLVPRVGRALWAHVSAGGNPRDPRRLDDARDYYMRSVRALHPGAQVLTDKRPDNFLHVGLIKQLFPAAKIVRTVRDPLDTCLSVFFTHFDLSQAYATNLLDIAHWYTLYERLMSQWKTQYGADILEVCYEDLVTSPQVQIARLLDFVGLDWDDACMHFHQARRSVQTPSVWQVRQPLYASSCGRWRHYRRHLTALAAALGRPLP